MIDKKCPICGGNSILHRKYGKESCIKDYKYLYKEIPENSSLSIKTSGLLGEQYIALTMGFDDGETAMLKNGSQIQDTKSAMVLEDLIGQFLYGDKKADGNAEKAEPEAK